MIDFVFEESPWESYLNSFKSCSSVPAIQLLTMLEAENDDALQDMFYLMEEKHLSLDLSTLPKPGSLGQAAARLKQEEEYVSNGFLLSAMEETDPLRVYLEELSAIPAFGDEQLLAAEHAEGKKDHSSALTNLGLSRVVELSKEYVGYGVLLMDLIQEGSIGLWQGIHSYREGDYASHRDYMIRSSLTKAVLLHVHSTGIGQKLRQSLQDYRAADEKLLMELGRIPTLAEIAEAIHVTLEEADIIRKMMGDVLMLEQVNKTDAEPEESQEEELAVEDTAYFQIRQRISELLSELSEEDAMIISMRFGLDKGLPMTAEEVAKKLRITSGEVTAREASALAKLRGSIT